jgi:beta-glucanase (GH16 family)
MAAFRLHGTRSVIGVTAVLLLGLGCSSSKPFEDTGVGGGGGFLGSNGGASGGDSSGLWGGTSTGLGGTTGSQPDTGGASGGRGDAGLGGNAKDAEAPVDSARKDGAADSAARDGAPDASLVNPDGAPVKRDTSADESTRGSDADNAVPAGYKLVWADEFETEGKLDPKNWNYEKGFVRNNELQWYQSDNATVKDGLLIIEGRKERVSNPSYKAGSSDWKTSRQYAEYTSTSMTTSGLQMWQYGRLEMRGRIPTGPGMWPAWWTLGVKGEWPSNGEIDIMEYYNGKVLANIACGTSEQWTAKWDSATKSLSSLGAGWADKFHVWRMDWDDQKIDLYLDDTLMNTATLSSMLNADGTSPFKQKVYMILNLAIGGDNGGDPSGTTFPVKYEIDYVRVFQKL